MTREVFSGCTGLSGSVYFSENINYIADLAFRNCGINEYYFVGDAPEVSPSDDYYPSFDSSDKIYYPLTNSTWMIENRKWNGYNASYYFSGTMGDINGDGMVDVKDVYMARLIAAKIYEPTKAEIILGDVDGDGRITAIDANFIRKFAIGMISEFPVEKA